MIVYDVNKFSSEASTIKIIFYKMKYVYLSACLRILYYYSMWKE